MDIPSSFIILVLGLITKGVSGIGPPDFTSTWVSITAYSATSEITISHNIGSLPILVDVQVKVQDPTEGEMIFSGIGSAQKGNENNNPFGGVLYIYNAQEVKIISPGPSSCSGTCPGFLVYTGGTGYSGPTTVSGQYSTAEVRVRLWSMCNFIQPGFISPKLPLTNADPFLNVPHSLGKTPDLVIVQADLDNGYVMDGHGSAFFTSTTTAFGGVIFGFDRTDVRVWRPKRGMGSSPSNGVPFAAMDGWGVSGNYGYSAVTNITVWAWSFSALTHNPKISETKTWKGHNSAEDLQTVSLTPFDIDTSIVKVEVIPDDASGVNNGFVFYGSGTTMSNGVVVAPNEYYGTLLYGIKHTGSTSTLMMWRPSDSTKGCMTVVDGLWGNNYRSQCSMLSIAAIKLFKTSTATAEPACGELPCTVTPIGPTCNCNGTGKEGQFCNADVMCSYPLDKVNSHITNFAYYYKYNMTTHFACNVGHIYASGSSSRRCQEDKTWSGSSYICQRQDIPTNQRVTISSISALPCDYTIVTLLQTSTGEKTWPETTYICLPIPCVDPTSVINTAMNVSGRTSHVYLDETHYTCNPGYSLKSGNLTIICGASGNWEGELPTCDISCGDPIASTADRTNWGNTIGVTATFVCKEGYEFQSGDYDRTCQNDGTWDNSPLVCKRKDCGAPDNGTNSGITYSSTLFEDTSVYTCDEGYHSGGIVTMNRTCQADQTWSLAKLDCTRVLCPAPDIGNNTHVSSVQGNHYMDKMFFACKFGYRLISGDLSRQCESDTSWSGQPPICEEIICPMLENNITNGNLTVTGTTYGSLAVVVCQTNYAIKTGSPMRMCDTTGTWSGTAPECKAVQIIFLDDAGGAGGSLYWGNSNGESFEDEDLKVHWKSTSNYKRTLKSIWDGRITAIAMGAVGTTVLAAVVAFICCLDCLDIAHHAEKDRRTKHENLTIDDMEHEYTSENIT